MNNFSHVTQHNNVNWLNIAQNNIKLKKIWDLLEKLIVLFVMAEITCNF